MQATSLFQTYKTFQLNFSKSITFDENFYVKCSFIEYKNTFLSHFIISGIVSHSLHCSTLTRCIACIVLLPSLYLHLLIHLISHHQYYISKHPFRVLLHKTHIHEMLKSCNLHLLIGLPVASFITGWPWTFWNKRIFEWSHKNQFLMLFLENSLTLKWFDKEK